jgi:hypothetical protein
MKKQQLLVESSLGSRRLWWVWLWGLVYLGWLQLLVFGLVVVKSQSQQREQQQQQQQQQHPHEDRHYQYADITAYEYNMFAGRLHYGRYLVLVLDRLGLANRFVESSEIFE